MIILTIQGAGKSYAAKNFDNAIDIDIKDYNSVEEYVNALVDADAEGRYVLGNISPQVVDTYLKGDKKTVMVLFAPFKQMLDEEEYELLKACLFGRYVLRKTQTKDNVKWLEKMKRHFDDYCDIETYMPYLAGREIKEIVPVAMTLSWSTVTHYLNYCESLKEE